MNCTVCGADEEHFSGEECVNYLRSKLDAAEKEIERLNGDSTIHWRQIDLARIKELESRLDEERKAYAAIYEGLKDPATVWANMLRGEIARPKALEHYEQCTDELESLQSRLDAALKALQAYLDAGTWDRLHDAHNAARAVIGSRIVTRADGCPACKAMPTWPHDDSCPTLVEKHAQICGALFPPGQFAVQACSLPKGHVGEHRNDVKGV